MHSKSDRIDVMNHDKEDEVIEERFQSLPSGEEIGLETSIKVYVFFFYCIHILYYKYHEINLNCRGSYVHSPAWVKKQQILLKMAINAFNMMHQCTKLFF